MHEATEVKMESTLSQGTTIELYAEFNESHEYKICVAGGPSRALSRQDVTDMCCLGQAFRRIIESRP